MEVTILTRVSRQFARLRDTKSTFSTFKKSGAKQLLEKVVQNWNKIRNSYVKLKK